MEPDEYDVLASVEGRHWWHAGMRKLSAALLDRAELSVPGEVLDAGCGTGGNSDLLARYGRVWGLDISPMAVRRARLRFPGRTILGSVEALPFAAASFDLVASFEVLYHGWVADESRALREAARVLRRGGNLLLRLPAYASLLRRHDMRVHTRRRYRLPEARRLLESAGFRVRRATYVNSLLLPAIVVSVILERLRPRRADSGSELRLPGRLVNRLLGAVLAAEASRVARGGSFPAGLSILCLGEKQ